jgi:prevent-host-death family protein
MDVAVTELRAHLSDWLTRVRRGEEVVVTERGIPIARLSSVEASSVLAALTELGIVGRADGPRPSLSARTRPRVARSLADTVSEQRG